MTPTVPLFRGRVVGLQSEVARPLSPSGRKQYGRMCLFERVLCRCVQFPCGILHGLAAQVQCVDVHVKTTVLHRRNKNHDLGLRRLNDQKPGSTVTEHR